MSESVLQAFRETGAYLQGHFRLTSGLHSSEYVQCALVLQHPAIAERFGRDTVPYLLGMGTSDGIPLTTVNRTASLYGGNAALNPPKTGAI